MANKEPKQPGRSKIAEFLTGGDRRRNPTPCTGACLGNKPGVCANISAPLIDRANYEPKTKDGILAATFKGDGRETKNLPPCVGVCLNEPNGDCAEAFVQPKKKRS